MTLASAACPLTDVIEDQTRAALDGIVNDFRIDWVWMPPWGPDKITDDGREMLRALASTWADAHPEALSVASGRLRSVTDDDQKTTYAAEDMVLAWLASADPATGEVQVTVPRDGRRAPVTFSPEPEPRFGRPAEVQPFVDRVLDRLRQQSREFGSNYRGRERAGVDVFAFKGFTKATYRDGVMSIPDRERGGAWALRGMVVLHELAHHLNTGVDGTIIDHHGEGFRATFLALLEDIGWTEIAAMLREAYRQSGLDRQRPDDDGMLAKIGKLLRHAEGASTEAERDAFVAKAQELATVHSIELAVARASHADGEKASMAKPTFELVKLGHRGQQSNSRLVALMLAIAHANDLRCTITGDNTAVTLYGFAGDIDVAKRLYIALVVQMVADADAYIRSGRHRPVHGRTARAAFYAGWTHRIGERLLAAQHAGRASAGGYDAVEVDERTGEIHATKAVALVSKELEIDDYFAHMRRQHGVRGRWRGTAAVWDGHSHGRGRIAADAARLGQQGQLPAQR